MARRRKQGAAGRTGGRRVAAVALLGAVVSLALYAPTASFDFVNWDDWVYVVFNPHLGELDRAFARWCLTAFYASNWHPVTLLSYGLDHALWGRDAAGYHRTNALLHAANSALVVWVAWRLFRRTRGATPGSLFGAAVVGLVFAVHPLHVESVAWVSERKDVLYGLFWLAALIAWLTYVDPDAAGRRRRAAYGLALASYTLSALSKPMAVTLPLVLLILDVQPLRRLARGRDVFRIAVTEKLPFYVVSIVTTVLTVAAQQASGAVGKADLSLPARLGVAVRALGFYLAKWVAPLELVPLYPLDPAVGPLTAPFLGSLAAVVALVAAAVALRHRAPWFAAGLAFTVVTLLPVLGLVELGYHSAADRYTYIPMLGPTLLAGAAAAIAWDRSARGRWIAAGVAAAFLAFLGGRTSEQVFVWRDSLSLWRHVVAAYPDSAIGHYNLGHAHAIAGRADRAEAEWRRTLEIDDRFVPALYELGAAAGRERRYATARRYFEAALAADPGHARARLDLAMVLEELGDWPGAARHYREFVRTAPPALAESVEHARSRLAARGAEGGAAPGRPNVLLVTVDTLRADHLTAYGFELDATPRLDELAAEGVVFERAIAASSATAPSHASMMTSRFPREHTIGWRNGDTRLERATTLAERFREAGYETAAFVGNVVLRARVGLDRGFDVYDDDLPTSERNRPFIFERIAGDTTLRAETWLETARAPFFLWVHYQDPHGPYTPPEGYAGRFSVPPEDDEPELPVLEDHFGDRGIPAYQALEGLTRASEYRARYAEEVYYADEWIGRLVRRVDARSGARGAIVLFTSDHGENLGDFGRYFVHAVSALPPEAHVPLIVRAPGLAPGRRGDTVGHVDVMPTLLELAGLPVPEGLSGVALGPYLREGRPLPDRLVYCDIGHELAAYRADELIRVRPAYDAPDAGEAPERRWWRHPWRGGRLEPSRPVDDALRERIGGYLGSVVPWVPAGPPSAEQIERLRALGYAE